MDSYCNKSDREPRGHTRQMISTIISLNIHCPQLKLFSLSVAGLSQLKEDKAIFCLI